MPGRVGQRDVAALRATMTTLQGVARETGGWVPALATAAEKCGLAARRPGKDSIRRECLELAARGYTSAGWSSFDGGRNRGAWDMYRRGLQTAEEAGDPLLAVDLMRRAGVLAAERGEHGDALRLFDLALIRALDAEPSPFRVALESSLHGCAATSYAAIGRRDLAASALAKAEDAALDDVETADLAWRRAETFAAMGDLDKAHEHATASLESWPAGAVRDTVKAEITLGGLHRRAGDSAAEAMLQGVRHRVEATGSVRARYRLAVAEGTLPA